MTTKTKQQFISDKFFYNSNDLVEVNALDFIQLLIDSESDKRLIKYLKDKVECLEVALSCARTKHIIDLRG